MPRKTRRSGVIPLSLDVGAQDAEEEKQVA